jgi:phosphoglycolate phosphatase-like HAD superfamily hydrolase
MIKLLIFDFDDTLLHLNVDWFSFEKELYSVFNVNSELESKLSSFTLPQKLNYLSNDSISLKKSLSLQEKYESICVASKDYLLFGPMLDFLTLARSKGFSIAIVSANLSSTIKSILDDLKLTASIDLVVGRDTCTDCSYGLSNTKSSRATRHVHIKAKTTFHANVVLNFDSDGGINALKI